MFFIIKIVFAITESFDLLLYRNNLATKTALTGESYLPVRKRNMFVDIGVKVLGLVAKASRLLSVS